MCSLHKYPFQIVGLLYEMNSDQSIHKNLFRILIFSILGNRIDIRALNFYNFFVHMGKKLFKTTIQRKVTGIVAITVLIIGVLFIAGLQWIKSQWEDQVLSTTEKNLDIVVHDWSRLAENVQNESKQLFKDSNVTAYMHSDDALLDKELSAKVSEKLFDFAIKLNSAKSLCIIKNPQEYVVRNTYRYYFTGSFVEEFLKTSGRYQKPTFCVISDGMDSYFLLYVEPIYLSSSGTHSTGYLLLYIDRSELDSIFAALNDDYNSFALLDADNRFIFRGGKGNDIEDALNNPDIDFSSSFSKPYRTENLLLLYRKFQLNQWAVAATINKTTLFSGVDKAMLILSVGTGIVAIIAFWVILHSFSAYYKRIESLNATSARIKAGNINERFLIDGDDEISTIGIHFNETLDEIEALMKKDALKEIRLRDAQLSVLRHQINPHFLYNTLDTIRMLAVQHDDLQIKGIVEDLSFIFRYSLDDRDADTSTVRKEIESIRRYIRIQDARFPGYFTYVFDIDEDILEKRMYKFLLEPIVENAFIHGITATNKTSKLCIRGNLEHGKLCFSISNTGAPMDEDTLVTLKEYARYEKDKDYRKTPPGIGFRNVIDRMHIYFGKESGIDISSSDEETRITLRFPVLP